MLVRTWNWQSAKFRIDNFLSVIDRFVTALQHRLGAYELISSRFAFLRNLDQLSAPEIQAAASNLVAIYQDDLDVCFGNELVQFAEFVNAYKDEQRLQSEDVSRENFMYQLIVKKRVQSSFPNVEIALRIYLVLMVSNCSAERSFSKMKSIKNKLRTSMETIRLTYLWWVLSLTFYARSTLRTSSVINDFAKKKARKVSLL